MKAAGIIAILLAVIVGLWALGDYDRNETSRRDHSQAAWRALDRTDMAAYREAAREEDGDNEAERWDGAAGVASILILVGSLVLFSKARAPATPPPGA